MRLIAWDTSSKEAALVALEWNQESKSGWPGVKLVAEWALNVDLNHSERLLWGIDQILESARWGLGDVDLLGVGVGPGSFTGLRIGVTTARTLALTLNKPLLGVSSLAALARPAASWLASKKARTVVIAATDAAKGELFGLFGSARSILDCAIRSDDDHAGLWKRGVEEKVMLPGDLMQAIKRKLAEGDGKSEWVAVGEGRFRYPEAWKTLPVARRAEIPDFFSNQVQGRYLGQIVWEAFQAGLHSDPARVLPRYLRASDAEVKLKAGLLKK